MFSFLSQFESLAMLLLRVVLGFTMMIHGLPKVKNPELWAKNMGFSKHMGWFVSICEFGGGLLTVIGLWTQLAAVAICTVMGGALYHHISVWEHPFTAKNGESWEFAFLIFCVAFLFATAGAGMYSLDYSMMY